MCEKHSLTQMVILVRPHLLPDRLDIPNSPLHILLHVHRKLLGIIVRGPNPSIPYIHRGIHNPQLILRGENSTSQ